MTIFSWASGDHISEHHLMLYYIYCSHVLDSNSFHKPSIYLYSFSPQLYWQSGSVSALSSSGEKKVVRKAGNAGKIASTTTALSDFHRDYGLLRSILKKYFTNVTMDFRELWHPCTNENKKAKTKPQNKQLKIEKSTPR